jgi:hypothetical protein
MWIGKAAAELEGCVCELGGVYEEGCEEGGAGECQCEDVCDDF